ncbi:MAG: hypothetical protein IJT83_05330, partial [Victivallales bacterium]|nr:hypothetical protein [Victivallales bacterium]
LSSLLLAVDVTTIPAMKPPVLDGIVDAAEWEGTAKGGFIELRKGGKPSQPTEWRVGCDKDNLFFAFKCMEQNVAGMRRRFSHAEERDNAIFTDDCVEVFIDIFGTDKAGLFHFIINTNGIIYDAFNGDTAYQSGIQVACKVETDFWVVEAQIPFADLGLTPKGAELLRLNLGRERQPLPAEYSCLGDGSGGFMSRDRLRLFRPTPNGDMPPVTFYSIGSPTAPQLHFANTDRAAQKVFNVVVEPFDISHTKLREFSLKTKPAQEMSLEYGVAGRKKVAGFNVKVLPDGGTAPLYENTVFFPATAVEKKLLARPIEKPLFKELLSKEYLPQRSFHGFHWVFVGGNGGNMHHFALQNAIPFSNREAAMEHKATGMAQYSNAKMIGWLNDKLLCKELGTPIAAMPRVLEKDIKSGLPHGLVVIPEVRALWLEDIRSLASNPQVTVITFADEVSESLEGRLITEYQAKPDHPALKAFDAMIKEKYGHGKYGILNSPEEKDPLAWLAYRRALNDELVSLYHEAYKLAKSINPKVVIVSDDPVALENKIYSFADWQGSFDIVTHQLYPSNDANIDSFGFLTRHLAQLTGAKEVWPCPHVEEYGASFTPQEVLYKLSAAVRNGATGFHYYLNDTIGLRAGKKYMIHERWGAPDRYAVELGAQKLMATLPRLAFPAYDTAVFTATDTLRAMPGLMLREAPKNDKFLHGYLGYGAGVNYRFINELTLDNLLQYKMIFTVENTYLPRESFDALCKYVSDGGTLVVIYQNSFAFTTEGENLAAESSAFTGTTFKGASTSPMHFSYAGIQVPVNSIRCAKLEAASGANVLAKFANGDPAMIEKTHGKGRVVSLAANPCLAKLASSAEWKGFFLSLCKQYGAKTQCDIWRFQLPDSLLPKQETIPGKCLTNNFVKWEHFNPTAPNNCKLTGSYRLSPEPNLWKERKSGDIAFSEGKLTDRPKAVVAPATCKDKGNIQDWAVGWKNVADPITIKANWSEAQPIRRVKLFVSGPWRDAKLEIGGQSYDFPCPQDFNKDDAYLREVTMELPKAVTASELAIVIGANKETLLVAEMEIWAE